jgi:hypothetical protein
MPMSAKELLLQMTLDYLVKAPLSARVKTGGMTVSIPRGALLKWLPPDRGVPPDGLTSVQWQREDYLVNSAELYQNCERA